MTITQARLKELLDYDPLTGLFTRRVCVRYRPFKIGDVAGTVNKLGYVIIQIDGRLYKAHRLAWLYTTGEFPKECIDHINRCAGDNRWENLREATHAQNMQNKRMRKDNVSGYVGVSWKSESKKWYAQIDVDGRCIFLGYFADPEAAYRAYLAAAAIHHTHSTASFDGDSSRVNTMS